MSGLRGVDISPPNGPVLGEGSNMQTTTFLFTATRMRLTYGELPRFDVFEACWEGDLGPDRPYVITNCDRVGNREYRNAGELYTALCEAKRDWAAGDESAGDWVSAVLSTFGIEWVQS
jgi:hypothetical protein